MASDEFNSGIIVGARFNTDGTIDPSFGGGQEMLVITGNADYVFGIALQSDGNIVGVGSSNDIYLMLW